MNRDLLKYYLGQFYDDPGLSPQCVDVRLAFLDDSPDDLSRLSAVLGVLDGIVPIEDDTILWLWRGIRGHYGGEGYVLEVTPEDETEFWLELASRYPRSEVLRFVAADALFPGDGSLEMFLEAFEINPRLVWELEGSVAEAFSESERAATCELYRVRCDITDGDKDEIDEAIDDFREIFKNDPEALRQLDEILATHSEQ